ncbi:hypothetical protein GS399_07260 [Pedobacter sp. HMF7647]|uniref:DUF3471 domain-containing protein n=1 Tax=Hufsiella arboris TaxID=2695275 RepID=A0A7K1Y869_9SPHI|nr:hypothetical protein [Hufsiella arboris]MXV50767.1 hypothetical protein [Hufsiella arboris]
MKKSLILTAIIVFASYAFSKSAMAHAASVVAISQADSLTAYTGKYEKDFNGKTFYLEIFLKDGVLVGKQLWDNQEMALKHLDGDNFTVPGIDWSVKFLRDASGLVDQVLVMGTDYWKRVKKAE